MSTIVFMYHICGASTVFCTFRLIGTCCPLDQELHLWKLNSLLPRSTLDVNDVDQTIRSMVAMPSQRSGHVLASHVPHDGTRVLASLKTTVGTDHNFTRLRIDHLDYVEYCSFFTRFASVSSYDAVCSCSASFQLFTRLLHLRSVMRFLLSFLACCWLCSFLACCWLCSLLVAYVHHPSLVDLGPAPAPGLSPCTLKSLPQFAAGSYA